MARVYIDPGHGGRDPGAVDGKSGTDVLYTEEEDLTLTVGMLLYDALKRCGVNVGISRMADVYPSLGERARKANEWLADCFVSVHFNAHASAAKGMEVLYYPSSVKGKKLAANIYDHLAPITPWGDRGLKARDNLYVLRATSMPAVIVEYDFITSEEAERLVVTEAYLAAAAEATARGVCDWLPVPYVAPDGNEADDPTGDPDDVHIIVARQSKYGLVEDFCNENSLTHWTLEDLNVPTSTFHITKGGE